MWAAITAFFTGITSFDDILTKFKQMFTKTTVQQNESVATDTQKDQNSIDTTGRPQ